PVTHLPPASAVAAPSVTTLNLAACRQLALERQPALAAARSSLAAAESRVQGLDSLRVPGCLAPDLATRRQQAAPGALTAPAGIVQADLNTRYGVDYSYLSALYARTQLKVADEAIASLKDLLELIRESVKAGRGDLSIRDADKVVVYLQVAEGRREE